MAIETDFSKELENFRKRCLELEEKSRKDEMRCLMLENEVENLKKTNQELEGKIAAIQKVVGYSDDILEVMIENKVLECEKQKAETELCFWKEKVKELEANINALNEKVKDVNVVLKGSKEFSHSQVRKRLSFEEDGCPNEKTAPSTPGVGQSPFHGIIDISDEDVNYNENPKVKKVSDSRKCGDSTKSQCSSEVDLQKTSLEHMDEEHMGGSKICSSNRSGKRKRAANMVTSDDEDSYDDNAPISTLKTRHSSRVITDSEEVNRNVSRRYPTRLSKSQSKNKQDESTFDLTKISNSSDDEEDNDGVDESESEGGSLNEFIVDSLESGSDCDSESDGSTDETEDVANELNDETEDVPNELNDETEDVVNEFKVTLDKIGRKKISNYKWDLEGDMLSDFGKDPALCMSAVCALYRKQTADEKACKETIYHNERGFSHADAPRGSKLGEFLTEGDPNGDLNKTVEELKEFDSKGIKLCMALAAKYSKQLFMIYQQKEDPYFPPQR